MSLPRPEIPAGRFATRLANASRLAAERDVTALLIGVGADLRYLTGYVAMALERLTMLAVPAEGSAVLVAPRLEALPARHSPAVAAGFVELRTWDETDDPVALVAELVGSDAAPRRLAVSDRLWATFLLALQRAMPAASFGLASEVLTELRIVKDPAEIDLLRTAALAADRVIAQVAAGPLIGRTEADVAREIDSRLVAEGHDTPEFAIVGSGPNSASPHHEASERVIRPGEPLLLDIGGTLGGYGSDVTRVLWLTGGDPAKGPDAEYRRLYDVLRDAQAEATHAVRPGMPAERVDAIARTMIAGSGYGPNFIHRIGHGIGLEAHEEPYLVEGNAEPLRSGMAFSVEPGIYLEGRYGARIEDIVVCGEAGPIVLNQAPRDLLVVDG
jgi:Xaa-Pro aminopeptidase